MKILIIGGGGMVGQKLAHHLAREGLNGDRDIAVTLFDVAFPEGGAPAAERVTGNLTDSALVGRVLAGRFDLIFHLAAIVSGESETDFDLGWSVNMMSFWHFLEALRGLHDASGGGYRPKLVFTSSIAVFGAPFPEKIPDDFFCTPQTSYGAQKAISELMLNDFARKGVLDGIAIRLPTICVRPGKANLAASSFFSGIIREPLNGVEAILPVPDEVRHWHASPRAAVGFLTHAASLDTGRLEGRRALTMPGVSCTVAEQIEALRKVAGEEPVTLIRRQPDERIMTIVGGWPRDFDPARALALGFRAEADFEEIVRIYIEDDLKR